MKTSKNPDFRLAMEKANEILVSSKVIDFFPFAVNKLIKDQANITCRTFAKAVEKYNVPMEEFGSESAIITKKLGRSMILYCCDKPKTHIRFSILHEFGHAVLGHPLAFEDGERYGTKEVETNFFTAQILMPEQLLIELQCRGVRITNEFLVKTFGVSKKAAEKRLNTLRQIDWDRRNRTERNYDDAILLKYKDFLNSIQPKKFDSFEDEYEMENERNSWQ